MADVKISALPADAAPTTTDSVPTVDAETSTTKKVLLSAIRTLFAPWAIASEISGLGANVAAMLAAFSSANIRTACTDETGTGALVFGTAPTISDPVVTSTRINNAATGTINDCTLSGTSGFFRRVYFTNAGGATVTGFDATGVADGTLLFVTALGATGVSLQSEAAGSAAANRITTNSNFTEIATTGCFTLLQYDLTNTRWRALAASAI